MGSRSKPRVGPRETAPGRRWKGKKKPKVARSLRFTAILDSVIAEIMTNGRKGVGIQVQVDDKAHEVEKAEVDQVQVDDEAHEVEKVEPRTTRQERRLKVMEKYRLDKRTAKYEVR